MTNDAMAGDVAGGLRGPPEDLCLAFANTRYWRGTETPTDDLRSPDDLLRWCGATAGWGAERLRGLGASWSADPGAATAALAEAVALREALYRLFSATAAGAVAGGPDLDTLNAALAGHAGRTHLRAGAGALGWALPPVSDPHVLLAPVLWSAGDLLAGRRLARVRRCANDRCLYLFLDDSKSGTRRWCDMSSCGNRAKAHRHYARVRAAR